MFSRIKFFLVALSLAQLMAACQSLALDSKDNSPVIDPSKNSQANLSLRTQSKAQETSGDKVNSSSEAVALSFQPLLNPLMFSVAPPFLYYEKEGKLHRSVIDEGKEEVLKLGDWIEFSWAIGSKTQNIYIVAKDSKNDWYFKKFSKEIKELESIKFRDSRKRLLVQVSFDEKWLFYSAKKTINSSESGIEVLNLNNLRSSLLLSLPGDSASVQPSPSGKKIVFRNIFARKDQSHIWVADIEEKAGKLVASKTQQLLKSKKGLHLSPLWIDEDKILLSTNYPFQDRMQLAVLVSSADCLTYFNESPENQWWPQLDRQKRDLFWVSISSGEKKILRRSLPKDLGSCEKETKEMGRKGGHK